VSQAGAGLSCFIGVSRMRAHTRAAALLPVVAGQKETARRCGPFHTRLLRGVAQLQPANLNEPTRVLQLKAPFAVRYSVVNQNVQSSTGSSVSAL